MPEWTVTIETAAASGRDEHDLERFIELLERDPVPLGAAASLDVDSGVLAATFQVEADTFTDASTYAHGVFLAIAHELDVEAGRLSLDLEVEPAAAA